jgi:inosose dehydratase
MRLAYSVATRSPDERDLLFRRFREAGFEGLQLKPNQYAADLAEPRRFLAQWPDAAALASGLIVYAPADTEGLERLRAALHFGAAVGSRRIIYPVAQSRQGLTAEDLRTLARTLSTLGAEARERGVSLSLHNHDNSPLMSQDDIALFFETAPPGTFGLTLDTAHLVKSGETDVAGVIRRFADLIDNIHLKDYAGGAWQVLGRGEIDFPPIFAAIREIGYQGWLCADEESGGDLLANMQACLTFITRHV